MLMLRELSGSAPLWPVSPQAPDGPSGAGDTGPASGRQSAGAHCRGRPAVGAQLLPPWGSIQPSAILTSCPVTCCSTQIPAPVSSLELYCPAVCSY